MKTSIDVAGQTLSATLRLLPGGYSATTLVVLAGERCSVMGKGESPDRSMSSRMSFAAQQRATERPNVAPIGLRR
jgi:hypothetical protein